MDSEFAFGSRPALTTYEGLAKMIDHSLVRPELTNEQIEEGCRLARQYHVASVCVRPSDLEMVVRLLDGSDVLPGSVCGLSARGLYAPARSSTNAATCCGAAPEKSTW